MVQAITLPLPLVLTEPGFHAIGSGEGDLTGGRGFGSRVTGSTGRLERTNSDRKKEAGENPPPANRDTHRAFTILINLFNVSHRIKLLNELLKSLVRIYLALWDGRAFYRSHGAPVDTLKLFAFNIVG